MKDAVKQYLSSIGARGGRAGTGQAKRRSPSHYRKMAIIRWRKCKNKIKK